MALNELIQITNQIGPEATTLLLAMDVIRRHVDALPAPDRGELVRAIEACVSAQTAEDRQEAFTTILEILNQNPITATKVEFDQQRSSGVQKWADHIGAKIRELRGQRGWTQDDLARQSGLPQSHISRLELGQHSPSHVTVEKLAKAFGIDPGKLDPSR